MNWFKKIIFLVILLNIGCDFKKNKKESNEIDINKELSLELLPKIKKDLPERISIKEIQFVNNNLVIFIDFNDIADNLCTPMYSHVLSFLIKKELSKDIDNINSYFFEYNFIKDNYEYEFVVSSLELENFTKEIVENKNVFNVILHCMNNLSNTDVHSLNLYLDRLIPEYYPEYTYNVNFFYLLIAYINDCEKVKKDKNLINTIESLYILTTEPPSKVDSKHMLYFINFCNNLYGKNNTPVI